ncbi:putative quinol monooxygenase [Lactiplantibacillus daoliensis]|uniref:Quinol monooxygenase n=1 Tax=Lactiplantibacillus daoliensis TaxID=2559916 RepID=A0ABW1UG90_9LACO|nr:antibiotic biosynthesis monooxygenase [Lactiplantibacillus daoliensis]
MVVLQQAPLFRLFKLRIKASERAAFARVGEQNLLKSITREPGTLAMYTGHLDLNGVENRVLELYRDQASYEIHAKSPQFQVFKTVAGQAVVEQSVTVLTPILLLTSGPALRIMAPTKYLVVLTEFTVKADQLRAFQSLLTAEMQTAMTTEPGLVTGYLGQSTADPQQLIVFDLYENETAYRQHYHTDHFGAFHQASRSLIVQQATVEVRPDVLVNQGPLTYERE